MKTKPTERIFSIFNYLFLALLSISIVYPFIHIISLSFSDASASLTSGGYMLLPKKFTFKSYSIIINNPAIYWGYLNTIFRTVVGTLLAVVILLGGAYALSKKELPHRKFYTTLFVITMFFTGGLIPEYLVIKNLGLIDNRWALVLPPAIQIFDMLIIRNFLMNIPAELEESAKIDGATEIKTLFFIILPVAMPVIATVALWNAVNHWNAWFDSMIYINDSKKQVIQMYLRSVVVQASDVELQKAIADTNRETQQQVTSETIKSAVLIVTIAPILAVYPFVQKYFVKGVMAGSVKG